MKREGIVKWFKDVKGYDLSCLTVRMEIMFFVHFNFEKEVYLLLSNS